MFVMRSYLIPVLKPFYCDRHFEIKQLYESSTLEKWNLKNFPLRKPFFLHWYVINMVSEISVVIFYKPIVLYHQYKWRYNLKRISES